MNNLYTYKIYNSSNLLPVKWDEIANGNIFLSSAYLKVLDKSAPENMICNYVGLFQEEELVGIIITQFLNLNKLVSFGERDRCLKTNMRNIIFKNFCSHILFVGNNMLTGQNAYVFAENIDYFQALKALKQASNSIKNELKTNGKKIHVTTFKDFDEETIQQFALSEFENNFRFSTQPNMVFAIQNSWKSEQDYVNALSKKYRDQYKRARKKAVGIEKRKLHLEDIIKYEDTIYDLYIHVARNAPFNTFFLAKNHFRIFKETLKDQFLFYGYFIDEKLIGFNTLIKNGKVMDTYFLGYDDFIQREKMLYLNMLYDMIAYSINKGFTEIVFARTALEIKSSVGAKPIQMFGLMEHSNLIINAAIEKLFNFLEPETIWKERNPFK